MHKEEHIQVHVGLSDPKYGRVLSQALEDRLEADYKVGFRASKEDAEQGIQAAEEFLREADQVLERIQQREAKGKA